MRFLARRRLLILRLSLFVMLAAAWACDSAAQRPPDSQVVLEPKPAVQSPGPPTTIRLVLQLQQDGTLRMVSSEPRRGEPTPDPSIDEHRQALSDGRARLVEYQARDATGRAIASGRFVLPLVAESEFQDPQAAARIRRSEERLTTPTIRIAIPYQASIASVVFERVEPTAGAEAKDWKRSPMGQISLSVQPAPGRRPR